MLLDGCVGGARGGDLVLSGFPAWPGVESWTGPGDRGRFGQAKGKAIGLSSLMIYIYILYISMVYYMYILYICVYIYIDCF